jgi:hypothetical protein
MSDIRRESKNSLNDSLSHRVIDVLILDEAEIIPENVHY